MGQVTRVLLLLAVVVPVTAYVAGSLASPGAPAPADHSPVILRDAPTEAPTTDPTTDPATTDPATPPPGRESPRTPRLAPDGPDDGPGQDAQRGDGDEARVVTPQPTPVGEDDDDERDDDDGPDDDDTDDEWDD
ncbi:hypothetical protein IEZ26_17185 [Nocardioides cavernae]|uniref:Small secreted hydrophilic protein n=1 Tax=Nocardioides cavernae TaxID=1921566 RepID=A0ABR8NE05_9ACTN|nr:hypothetical protein [Nocardioides cavernae]MBD3926363.1 hypothetical protein [Nocardioides cavernae]MBM7513956.1 hypothetical protein [Nocardioides cavernae]